ncbi:MAG: S-layer homology domain-containing protein [Acaryochloris sp. RU_4_1]|nr:S-layer homology domain-containing protein [Acaryochloris sp. RU_4_1]NJR53353.1 S-layer homology domain-containing protein [Acaryochloris sp. CRU_2_0]
MVSPKVVLGLGLFIAVLMPLTGCSRDAVQQAFSADPQASQWGNSPQLPKDFPTDLNYPNAILQGVQPGNAIVASSSAGQRSTQRTRWATGDSSQTLQRYYTDQLQKDQWQLTGRKLSQQQLILIAQRDALHVQVTIPAAATFVPSQPGSSAEGARVPMTVFFIDYSQGQVASTPQTTPQPGNPEFVGPLDPTQEASSKQEGSNDPLSQVPADLKPYINDLQQIGVLEVEDPNQLIQRGTFARWLVEVNNRLYRDRPTRQIRLASLSQKPAFTDVPSSNPNFPYIQGLAEAGFIPSPLSGDADQTAFQPNRPLTRETLLRWKVPVDFRKILSSTTAAKVQEVWGFKDTNRISAPALSAIFADHRNGELANIRRLLGSALLFQPQKPVTRAEAAASLWFIGVAGEGYSAKDVLQAEQQTTGSS